MSQKITAKQLAAHFHLKPLPVEGGMFARPYLSTDQCAGELLPARYEGVDHAFCSAIYMLFTNEPDSFSAVHRLKTDEVFHFYLGDPFELLLLYPDGTSRTVVMGQDVLAGQQVQFVVPAGVWQGSRLLPGGEYALFGTTMTPAFSVSDFEAGSREELLQQYPQEAERIRSLTRQGGERWMPEGAEA
jgi:predicted cupin superfamily sugar epimerase